MLILPTDKWTPEANHTYTLAPGTHNAVLMPDPRGITIIGQPGAVIVPKAPYECGSGGKMKLENVLSLNVKDGSRILRVPGIEMHIPAYIAENNPIFKETLIKGLRREIEKIKDLIADVEVRSWHLELRKTRRIPCSRS